jgi:hypothetical protein
MAKLPAIPENLHDQVMTWTGEGKPVEAIRALLKEQHNINCSPNAVYRLLKKIRQGRQEIAKAAYAAEMEKTANSDVKIMSEVTKSLFDKWKNAKTIKEELQIAAELRMWVRDKMALSGIDLKQDADEDIKDELLDELEDLKLSKLN